MPDRLAPRARVYVTDGYYKGRYGHLVRPDGALNGQPGWLVKLDDKMGGAFVPTRYLRVEAT